MLTELQARIRGRTDSRKFPTPQRIVRTIVLLASPSLFYLRDWFQQWFPIRDPEVARLYPWLLYDGSEGFAAEVGQVIGEAFDMDRANALILRHGLEVRTSVNQVLVVADLSEPGTKEAVDRSCEVLQDAVAKLSGPQSPVYWVGAFAIRRLVQTAGDGKQGVDTIISGGEAQGEEMAVWLGGSRFNRVFLIDVSNPQAAFLAAARDQYCVAGHLLYHLTVAPTLAGGAEEHVQWLTRHSPTEGDVAGFSAFSLVLPVDQIVETVTVARGAEVMRVALLEEKDPERFRFYFDNFREKNGLLNLEALRDRLGSDPDFTLDDPLRELPVQGSLPDDSYLATTEAIDAALPQRAKENGKLMKLAGAKLAACWLQSLEEHVEAILTQESGALPAAQKFLAELEKHVEGLVPVAAAGVQYGDSSQLIARLKQHLKQGPRTEAIYGRVVAGAALTDLAVFELPLGMNKALLLAALPVGWLAGGGLVHLGARERLRRLIVKLDGNIRDKWERLMRAEAEKVAAELLKELLVKLRALRKEVDAARVRVEELVAWFKENFAPAFPDEYAGWKYVLRERDELLAYEPMCRADVNQVARDYLDKDRPLFPWRRLAAPKTPEPNGWEWHMVELAAIRLLPHCDAIVELHILDYLQAEAVRQKFDRFKMAMLNAAQPFLNVRPEAPEPERNAVLEAESLQERPIVGELMDGLAVHYRSLAVVPQVSRYRISFFGLLDRAGVREIRFR